MQNTDERRPESDGIAVQAHTEHRAREVGRGAGADKLLVAEFAGARIGALEEAPAGHGGAAHQGADRDVEERPW